MKKEQRRIRNEHRFVYSRKAKEAARKTLIFNMTMISITLRCIGWYGVAAILPKSFRSKAIRRIKELEKEEAEVNANPFKLFGL